MSSKTAKHTPGPWRAEQGEWVEAKNARGIWVEVARIETHAEDAVLISAAPDLLAACEEFVAAHLTDRHPVCDGEMQACGAYQSAIAAISKAKGKQ